MQIMSKPSKLDYLKEMLNWIDIGGLFLTIFIMIVNIFELEWISFAMLRVIASIATCLNLLKIFDWLRLF